MCGRRTLQSIHLTMLNLLLPKLLLFSVFELLLLFLLSLILPCAFSFAGTPEEGSSWHGILLSLNYDLPSAVCGGGSRHDIIMPW